MFASSLRGFPLLLLLCSNVVSAKIPSSGCTANTPTPANKICGKKGDSPKYVQAGAPVIAYQTVNSLTECQDLCLRRANSGDASCGSFAYDSSSSLCAITPETLKSISVKQASTVIFYDRACFTCPSSCSRQPLRQDILDNSGFDISKKHLGPWFSSGGTGGSEQGGDIQGIQKGSYFCTAGKASKCSIRQSFSNCNTTVYKWSYDYKAASKNKKFDPFYATAYYSGENSHSLRYPPNSAAALKWHTYTDVVQLRYDIESSDMVFDLHPGKAIKGKTQNTFLADNIKLERTNFIVGPEPGAHNTLQGAFETGTLAPWTKTKKDENISITSPGIQGNYAAKWNIKKGPQTNPSFGIIQDLSKVKATVTVPGTPYLFNVDYLNNLPQGQGIIRPVLSLKLELFTGDANTTAVNIHNVYTQIHDGNEGTIRIPFMGQVNQNFVRFTITVLTPVPKGGPFHIIFDNISFKPLYTAS